MIDEPERSWILVGRRWRGLWLCRRIRHRVGDPASVTFDWRYVLAREERKGDVVGWYHTHPENYSSWPSSTDVSTMRAWASCFGKPFSGPPHSCF